MLLAFLTFLCSDLSVLSTRVKTRNLRDGDYLVEGDELDGSKSSGRTEQAIFRLQYGQDHTYSRASIPTIR